jgi:hypothetical protein
MLLAFRWGSATVTSVHEQWGTDLIPALLSQL